MSVTALIRSIPHRPKQRVMFRDITTLLEDPVAFELTLREGSEKLSTGEFEAH